jgi:hypothetical protein
MTTTPLTIHLPEDLRSYLTTLAIANGATLEETVVKILRRRLELADEQLKGSAPSQER